MKMVLKSWVFWRRLQPFFHTRRHLEPRKDRLCTWVKSCVNAAVTSEVDPERIARSLWCWDYCLKNQNTDDATSWCRSLSTPGPVTTAVLMEPAVLWLQTQYYSCLTVSGKKKKKQNPKTLHLKFHSKSLLAYSRAAVPSVGGEPRREA